MSEDLGILILDFDFAGEEGIHTDATENSRKKTQNLTNQRLSHSFSTLRDRAGLSS